MPVLREKLHVEGDSEIPPEEGSQRLLQKQVPSMSKICHTPFFTAHPSFLA